MRPEKIGQTVNGVPIYSEDDSTANLLKRMKVQEIIIALPDLTVERKQRLYERYRRTGCSVKIYDYPSGTEEKSTAKRTLRDFRIEDLLFRDPIEVENPETKAFYAGKTVLVTGVPAPSLSCLPCVRFRAAHIVERAERTSVVRRPAFANFFDDPRGLLHFFDFLFFRGRLISSHISQI